MKKFALFLAPLMAVSFLTNCGGKTDPTPPGPKHYTVTFNTGEGGSLVPPQIVEVGKCATKPDDPTKTKEGYTCSFLHWELDNKEFTFDTPINEDITLIAKWKEEAHIYKVTFDVDGDKEKIEPQHVAHGSYANKPIDPTREEDEQAIYEFKEWQLEGKKFEFTTPITSDITLKADWKIAHKYTVSVGETHDHLSFTTTDGKDLSTIKAIEGREFKFKMKVDEESSTDYLVPTSLEIKINDGPSLAGGYTITPNADEKEAEVSINADKVVGNIVISGKAAENLKYSYKVSAYDGLNLSIPDEGKQDKNQNLTITFTAKEKESSNDKYALPKKENIFIEFDNVDGKKEWISPAMSEPVIADEYCEYNEQSGILTIKTNHIKRSIDIKTRANDYPLLEKLSWEQIKGYSYAGWAPYIFYLGEEKTIKVNGIDQKVRIIDFNHDNLVDVVGKAGITFEFINLLSDSNGYSLATLWNTKNGIDSKNYDYLNSDLRKALDGVGDGTLRWYQMGSEKKSEVYTDSVLNMLPSDLQNNIETVKKEVAIGSKYDVTGYDAKVFVLTNREITQSSSYRAKEEGTTYQYYKDHKDDSSRIKQQIKGRIDAATVPTDITDLKTWTANNYAGYNSSLQNNGGYYWLASPDARYSGSACSVDIVGYIDSYYIYSNAFAVAPAFCI